MKRILFALTLIGATLISLDTAPEPRLTTKQCLVQAQTKQALEQCLPAVIDAKTYNLYQLRYGNLQWQNEAY